MVIFNSYVKLPEGRTLLLMSRCFFFSWDMHYDVFCFSPFSEQIKDGQGKPSMAIWYDRYFYHDHRWMDKRNPVPVDR